MGGSVKRSLAMVCPSAIAKAFGLDAATRLCVAWLATVPQPGRGGE
jgi:hypothetical protein